MASGALQLQSQAEKLMHSDDVEMDERFGGNTGGARLGMCEEMYEVYPPHQRPNQSIEWYTQDGKRALERHPCNQRYNKSDHDRLVMSILTNNIVYSVRGIAYLQQKYFNDFECWLILAWGSLITAAYDVMENHSHTAIAKKIKADGLRRATCFSFKMPLAVCMWLKSYHNEFNGGKPNSVLDWLQEWKAMSAKYVFPTSSCQSQ